MASPWGDSRYPPFPTPYSPEDRPRQQQPRPYIPQAVPGFYNPAVFSNQMYGPPVPAGPSMPSIPPALKPGGRGPLQSPPIPPHRAYSRDLAGDIFFGVPSFPQPQINGQMPQMSRPPQIRHSVSAPAPPIPQRPDFNLPPLPPKPPYSVPPDAPVVGPVPPRTNSHPHTGTILSSPREEPSRHPVKIGTEPAPVRQDSESRRLEDLEAQELQRALTLSARAADEAKRREDEEIARALQESLQVSSPVQLSSSPPSLLAQSVGSNRSNGGHSYASSLPPSSPASSHLPPPSPSTPFPIVESPRESRFGDDASRYTGSPVSSFLQIKNDEDFARTLIQQERLSAREERPISTSLTPASASTSSNQHSPTISQPRREPTLPRYDDIVAVDGRPPMAPFSKSAPATTHTSPNLAALPPSVQPHTLRPGPSSQASLRPSTPPSTLGRSTSANAVPTVPTSIARESEGIGGRSQSFGAYVGRSAARPPIVESLGDPTRPPQHHAPPARTPPLPVVEEGGSHPGPTAQQPASVTPPSTNQYIDEELLRGVTIGFSPPVMSAELKTMRGPIPDVIGLPYGRAPPLHFKSPNWHDMLMLMARMSGTRLQATVEAMALIKAPMQLRIVINFVKLHQSSPDWHVILYMTIDMPIPPEHKLRYRNWNDPSVLPYSYSLSPTPAYLREDADGPMSKWYTIPSTTQNPYLTLPVTFPDVATYLMSAFENSRRGMHDRSSGWQRLTKYVEAFYPTQTPADEEDQERSRRFGMGWLRRRNKSQRHDNDERSNLVTPFIPDMHGA